MNPLPPGPKQASNEPLAMQGLRDRPLDFIVEMASRYGDLVFFESSRDPILFVNHPAIVREVLVARTRDFAKAGAVSRALRVFDGQSILVSEGDQWRQQRRFLQQGLKWQHLRNYAAESSRSYL